MQHVIFNSEYFAWCGPLSKAGWSIVSIATRKDDQGKTAEPIVAGPLEDMRDTLVLLTLPGTRFQMCLSPPTYRKPHYFPSFSDFNVEGLPEVLRDEQVGDTANFSSCSTVFIYCFCGLFYFY